MGERHTGRPDRKLVSGGQGTGTFRQWIVGHEFVHHFVSRVGDVAPEHLRKLAIVFNGKKVVVQDLNQRG